MAEKITDALGDCDDTITECLAALTMARECIAYCRRAHPDPQSSGGIPVEVFIDAAIEKAEATLAGHRNLLGQSERPADDPFNPYGSGPVPVEERG